MNLKNGDRIIFWGDIFRVIERRSDGMIVALHVDTCQQLLSTDEALEHAQRGYWVFGADSWNWEHRVPQ